jgi:NADPH:quinone reductase-like Zn-dependent oxidoreductase
MQGGGVTDGEDVAEALWYVGPGRSEIRQEKLKPLVDDQVRVRALYGAVSRGTEALIAAGRVPASEYLRMRGPFMGGTFPFPVKYGYATVGRVEIGPEALLGRIVFALHPHQTKFDLPAEAVVLVPADVPQSRATLAANMETALNATWDAAPEPGARIAVIGAGVVGALIGFLCARIDGAKVTLVDTNPAREELARALGVNFALPASAPGDCDYVFHTSATAAGFAAAINIAAVEATILELSWYGTGLISVPLGGAFHSRRLKIVSSQVGMVAPSQRQNFTPRRRLEAALALTAHPSLDALLTPAVAFRELPVRLPDILKPQSGVLCQLVSYP